MLPLSPVIRNRVGKEMLDATYLRHSEMDSAPSFGWPLYLKHCVQKDVLLGNGDTSLQKQCIPQGCSLFWGRSRAVHRSLRQKEELAVHGGLPKDGKTAVRCICLFTQLSRHPKSNVDLLRYFYAEFQLYLNESVFALKFTLVLCCLELRHSPSTFQGRNA